MDAQLNATCLVVVVFVRLVGWCFFCVQLQTPHAEQYRKLHFCTSYTLNICTSSRHACFLRRPGNEENMMEEGKHENVKNEKVTGSRIFAIISFASRNENKYVFDIHYYVAAMTIPLALDGVGVGRPEDEAAARTRPRPTGGIWPRGKPFIIGGGGGGGGKYV